MIYGFSDYKQYLIETLDGKMGLGKGGRSRLSEAIGCQPAYLSQVLSGTAHLSLEQGHAANRFFSHSEEESEFFLLLIQFGRAGTTDFRSFIGSKIEFLRKTHHQLSKRVAKSEAKISDEQKAKFYSSWHYAAVHVATTIPTCGTVDTIAKTLSLPSLRTKHAVDFLVSCGLLTNKNGYHSPTSARIHLEHSSPLTNRFHSAWRLKTLSALEESKAESLHYSSAVTLAESDVPRVREILLEAISQVKKIVKDSPPESLYVFDLDWFKL